MSENKNNYVNNKEFYELMLKRKAAIEIAEERGEPKPRVSDEIGKIILDIATNLSYKVNFINYPFKDDMIGDAIENCIRYIDNFDPEASKNPFSYYTTICYYAFLRRIEREKKRYSGYKKYIEKMSTEIDWYDTQDQDSSQDFYNSAQDFEQSIL